MPRRPPAAAGPSRSLDLRVKAVDAACWSDLVRLFEARGGPKHCWCMLWRAKAGEPGRGNPDQRRAALHQRVTQGVPVGLLACVDGQPVGWCSIAPRETYRPLGGPAQPQQPGSVWSLVCFFVARPWRGQGVASRLVTAALEYAREHGAQWVEAYPVDVESPSYRFMGFVPMFARLGFEEVGRAGSRRHVMRRRL